MKIAVEIEVSDAVLSDIISTAVEGGINYWAYVEDYTWSDEEPETTSVHVFEQEPHGDERVGKVIGVEQIAEGVQSLLTKRDVRLDIIEAILAGIVDPDEAVRIDSEAADCIMQHALFGEVIYG